MKLCVVYVCVYVKSKQNSISLSFYNNSNTLTNGFIYALNLCKAFLFAFFLFFSALYFFFCSIFISRVQKNQLPKPETPQINNSMFISSANAKKRKINTEKKKVSLLTGHQNYTQNT